MQGVQIDTRYADVDWKNDPEWQNYLRHEREYKAAVARDNAMYLAGFNVQYDHSGGKLWGTPVAPKGSRLVPYGATEMVVPNSEYGTGFSLQRKNPQTGQYEWDTAERDGFRPAPLYATPRSQADKSTVGIWDAGTSGKKSKEQEERLLSELDRTTTSMVESQPRRIAQVAETMPPLTLVKRAPLTPGRVWDRITSSVRLAKRDWENGMPAKEACTRNGRLPYLLTTLIIIGLFLYAMYMITRRFFGSSSSRNVSETLSRVASEGPGGAIG